MKKKILITGSNGLLGQKLVQALVSNSNVHLIATARGENRNSIKSGYEYFQLDVTSLQQISDLLETIRPDVIIHTAAMTNVDACELEHSTCYINNVEAVKKLSDICSKLNIHLIHLSTDFIFDGRNGPYDEDALPNPLSYYGKCKWEAEQIVMKLKTPWTIIRTILVFGVIDQGSRSNVVLWVKNSLEQGKKIYVVNDQFRTPTLAEDLAQGCILTALNGATGIFNIAGPELMSIYDLAMRVADFFQLDKSLIHPSDSSSINQPAKRPPRTGLKIEKAKRELGYTPHFLHESLALIKQQLLA
ncbi:MAG: SDR family oxidoreductase [Flavobacteriales bacterium]|nr:SDR family oxidoreductase [Flavobacteriales bacterium]